MLTGLRFEHTKLQKELGEIVKPLFGDNAMLFEPEEENTFDRDSPAAGGEKTAVAKHRILCYFGSRTAPLGASP